MIKVKDSYSSRMQTQSKYNHRGIKCCKNQLGCEVLTFLRHLEKQVNMGKVTI